MIKFSYTNLGDDFLYREMRRKDREISSDDAFKILKNGEYGFLSLVDIDSNPYGVPISYVLDGNFIYLHCANLGFKLECIMNNPKVVFCVVGHTNVLPGEFSTEYESAICFGTASIVEDIDEIKKYMNIFCEKYSKDYLKEGEKYIINAMGQYKCIKIQIEHITGKSKK